MEKNKNKRIKSSNLKENFNIVELVEKVKKEEELSKFEKLEKVINIAFERIFDINQNDYDRKIKAADSWGRKLKSKH